MGAGIVALGTLPVAGAAEGVRFSLQPLAGEPARDLRFWSVEELTSGKFGEGKTKKVRSSRERDPRTGEVVEWKGTLLSDWVTEALSELSPKTRAEVDLLLLKTVKGDQAWMPRAFVVKYPILLAGQRGSKSLGDQSPQIVLPWTSRTRVDINQEEMPLEILFLQGVRSIEFANSKERFRDYRLTRRTDPSAIRGEKLFMSSCISCHAQGQGPALEVITQEVHAQKIESTGHPKVPHGPALDEKERRSVGSFLSALRAEASSKTAKTP